jgi:hypothetical protein
MKSKKNKEKTVRMKLTLDSEFYELLCSKAKSDYTKVATWTRQFLMKSLLPENNTYSKCLTQNENIM